MQELDGCYTLNKSYVHELLMKYHILGNFRVIKGLHEKISRSKIFTLWAFHEN